MPVLAATPEQVNDWLAAGEATLIDVREPEENRVARIKGGALVPLATLPAAPLPAHEGKKLVLYCRSGKRSQHGGEFLAARDPSLTVYNLTGGILAWAAASLPTEAS